MDYKLFLEEARNQSIDGSTLTLIESGFLSYDQALEGLARGLAAKAEENYEEAISRRWDFTHCVVCGADRTEETNHQWPCSPEAKLDAMRG